MPDPNLQYDPIEGWENTTTFKTSPTSQAQTRTLFQRLFTQIQTYLNTTYTSWINSTFATITNLNAAVLSGISDDSVTDAKLSATTGTVKDRVNTFLADGGITDAKLSNAGGAVKALATAHYIDYYKHGLTGTTDSSGSNTVYTLTPSPNALSAYAEYLRLAVVFDKANGGACTINVSGLGAKAIKKVDNTGKVALVAGDILALVVTNLVYDGTDFIVLNPVINDIPKSIIIAAGDLIYGSSINNPARLAKGGDGQVLGLTNGLPAWENKESFLAGGYSDTSTIFLQGTSRQIIVPLGANIKTIRFVIGNYTSHFMQYVVCNNSTFYQLFGATYFGNPNVQPGAVGFSYTNTPSDSWGIFFTSAYISGTNLILTFQCGNSSNKTINLNVLWEGVY